jgi:hypothetical protein
VTIDPEKARQVLDDRPPFLRTWSGVYAAVLGFLGLLILLFALLTRLLA